MNALALFATLILTAPTKPTSFEMIDARAGNKGGKIAANGDLVTLHYKGTLFDSGLEFDASYGKAPLTFRLGQKQVIPGFEKTLLGMKVGGRRISTFGSALGYAEKAIGEIPANSALVFDVELLRVDKKGTKPMIEIEEMQAGTGEGAIEGDKISLHYTGMFIDGTKFDSSRDRNQPFDIVLGKTSLIKGFTMGIMGMKQGERRKVTIPSELGYGEKGAGGVIPGNATLVFDIEVLSITK